MEPHIGELVPIRTDAHSPAELTEADFQLSEGARQRMYDAINDNTRKAYTRIGEAWFAWCVEQRRRPLPATPETLADYINHLADDPRKGPASLRQALSAIRTLHRVAGYKGQPDTDKALMVLQTASVEHADKGNRVRQAPPLLIDPLRQMVDKCDPGTLAGKRDRVLLVLGLASMLRRSELAALRISDLVETPDGLEVLVRKSKTDQKARGVVVPVPHGAHADTDPVRLVNTWLEALAVRGITEGPLLRAVDRHDNLHRSGRMSTDAINRAVRRIAKRAGIPNASTYTAHSLRAGGATVAYKAGAPVSAIAGQGRWAKNSPVVLEYIRAVDKWQDNPMRNVGL